MSALAAQPAEKTALQKLRVEWIGLRPAVFARHRDARESMTWGSTPCAASPRASQKPSCPASNATAMRVILWPFFSASARQRLNRSSNARSSIASSSTAGTQHQEQCQRQAQLDWLISITAINVASVSSGSRTPAEIVHSLGFPFCHDGAPSLLSSVQRWICPLAAAP